MLKSLLKGENRMQNSTILFCEFLLTKYKNLLYEISMMFVTIC